MSKEYPYITKYKDIHRVRIRVGDLIIHGMLNQIWLIKDKKTARIVSNDSGMGYEDELDAIGLGMKENLTEIIGSILREHNN